jgi:DnaJ-class molecular chaperone
MNKPTDCKKCEGTGKLRHDSCKRCAGTGKVVIFVRPDGRVDISPVLQ